MGLNDKLIIEIGKNSFDMFVKIINDEFEHIVGYIDSVKLYADRSGNTNFEITFPDIKAFLVDRSHLYAFYKVGYSAAVLHDRYGFKISWA